MSFPRYAEYVDSGVEWLEQVPSTWLIKRLGHFFSERREKVSDKEFTPLSVTKNGIVPRLDTAAKTQDGDNRKRVVAGDFVINSRSDRKGSSGLSALDGSVSLICIVLEMKEVFGRYAHHLLRSTVFQEEFYRFGKGIVADLWSTNFSEMKNILIPVPSRFEQTQIARFLDHETAKIDALIAEQKRLIKLLQEKRQAVISHAVTKGLDPNVPMKDSGVEWLGEVPAHWEVRKLKYCASLVTTKGASRENVISLENIEGGTGRFISTVSEFSGEGVIFEPQDVLFGKLRPYLAKVHLARTSGIALGDILVFRATEEFAPEFLFFMLISQGFIDEVNQSSYGTKMPRANPEYILGLFVTAPPREEQLEIANYLVNAQYDKILPTILNANRLMKLLEERRSALISAAVTGKIDVRDWQPPADENAFDEEVQKAGLEASA